jgi:hypothetical protein
MKNCIGGKFMRCNQVTISNEILEALKECGDSENFASIYKRPVRTEQSPSEKAVPNTVGYAHKGMSKELRNQFNLDDEEMKWAEEQFGKLKTFDLVEDTIEDEETPYPEDTYEKWMLYKAGDLLTKDEKTKEIRLKGNVSEKFVEIRKYFIGEEHDTEKNIIMKLRDPDGNIKEGKILGGSRLLQYIYKKLWPELTAREFMKHPLNDNQNIWICSDTMTSAQQRMNDFFQVSAYSDFENVRTRIGKSQKYSLRLCIELYLEDKNKFKEKLSSMENFLNRWHMLGNYIPVSRRFNSARSGRYAVHDYWDLTLLKIQEYYKKRDNEDEVWKILGEELLHGSGNALACKLWLDYFDSWENFIEKNYMQDFVDGNYEVELFFDGHDWNNPKPKTPDECKELFERSSEMIKKRTNRMVDALTAKIKHAGGSRNI